MQFFIRTFAHVGFFLSLQHYRQQRGITELKKLVGEELPNIVLSTDPDQETMVFPKFDHDTCIGCGRCYASGILHPLSATCTPAHHQSGNDRLYRTMPCRKSGNTPFPLPPPAYLLRRGQTGHFLPASIAQWSCGLSRKRR